MQDHSMAVRLLSSSHDMEYMGHRQKTHHGISRTHHGIFAPEKIPLPTEQLLHLEVGKVMTVVRKSKQSSNGRASTHDS
jgi:hypothetical protein